jgi:hypothetical protein
MVLVESDVAMKAGTVSENVHEPVYDSTLTMPQNGSDWVKLDIDPNAFNEMDILPLVPVTLIVPAPRALTTKNVRVGGSGST